jgi:hypothetical protein
MQVLHLCMIQFAIGQLIYSIGRVAVVRFSSRRHALSF